MCFSVEFAVTSAEFVSDFVVVWNEAKAFAKFCWAYCIVGVGNVGCGWGCERKGLVDFGDVFVGGIMKEILA